MNKEKLTFGERACGVSFNPGGIPVVNAIKKAYADIAENLNDIRVQDEDPEVKRMCSIAITELQTSQMWAVKAVTWNL
jgi:hypothetical protein